MNHAKYIRMFSLVTGAWVLAAGTALWAQQPASESPELSLSDAVEIALSNNRPAKIAQLDITKAKWQLAAIRTKRFPQISSDLFGSGNLTSPTFTFKQGIFGTVDGKPVPSTNVSISLSQGMTGYAMAQIDQPLSQLYKIGLAIHMQKLQVDLAGQSYEQQRQSLVASVKQAYYATLQTESSLDATRALVKQYQETDRVMLQYIAQKSVLESSSLAAKAQLAQAQFQIVQLSDTLVTQKEQLNDLLARDLDTPFRTQPVPLLSPEETDLQQARRSAIAQHPQIKQAEIDMRSAEYDRRLAKAEYIPDVSASVHYLSPLNTQILPQNILSAGVEMKWDPFEWGKRRDDVKQKETVVTQSRYQLDETRSQVLLNVDSTFRKLAESRSMLSVAQAQRGAANEKLREVNDQFSKSAVLLDDVLTQEATVANTNYQYEESLLAFWTAKANFEKALGEE